jgi:hypothetical protein
VQIWQKAVFLGTWTQASQLKVKSHPANDNLFARFLPAEADSDLQFKQMYSHNVTAGQQRIARK